MHWVLRITKTAQNQLGKIQPRGDLKRVANSLKEIEINPLLGDIRKLKGYKNRYARRVGKWRVIFKFEKKDIVVMAVMPRTTTTYRRRGKK